MVTYLRRTAYCALAVLGVFTVVGVVQAIRGTLPDFPHTILDWVSALAQTVLSAMLVGALLSLWLGWDEIKWPKPVRQIQFAYERWLGWFFVIGGVAQIGAALLLVGREGVRWVQTGVWRLTPIGQSFPGLPHLRWTFAESVLAWLMGTPAWIWAGVVGVLLIRMGQANLTDLKTEAND
jgi:hypothetical protein